MASRSFHQDSTCLSSVALWGAAGIGKTQIALEYANRLWSEGFNVIIWISSETNAERAKSFSDAARVLQSSEFSETNTPEKNQHLVLEWLQQTGVIARSFEVPPFTMSESTEMILRITEQCDAPEAEIHAARELSGELVENAKNELRDASLIRINPETGLMSVHRLLQHAYFLDMSAAVCKISIHNVLLLLRSYFPRHNGAQHLYSQWARCAALHHHVQTLRDKVAALKPTEPMDDDDQELYTGLIHDDIWYMIEIQHFLDAEHSLLSLLENTEKDSVSAAKIHRSLLGLYERTGRSIRAKNSASSEFEIVARYSESVGNDVANAWSNMGYTRVSAFEASDAVSYLDRAISIAKDVPEPRCFQEFNIDRFLRNRGRANEQMGRFEDALRDFDEAEYYHEKIHGPSSHYDGETKYERAKIEAWRGNLEEAYSLATRAHDLVSVGKPTHASVMAAQYRLGWIAMLRGDNEAALQHLEKSLAISRINEQHRGNAGESARVQWRMSQVLECMGREEEAVVLLEAAVKVKDGLLATGDYAQVQDKDSSWDALVGLLYR
ncbi:hypothetical protein V8C35DRAFT_322549 [Trichoderma chlorosporum]